MLDLPPYPPPKPKKPRLLVWQVEFVLRKNLGSINLAAKDLAVTTQAVRARIRSSRRLKQVRDEIDEDVGDFARGNVVRDVGQGNRKASEFWLKYRESGRWSARSVLSGDDTKPLNLNLGLDKLDAASLAELGGLLGAPKDKGPAKKGSDPR